MENDPPASGREDEVTYSRVVRVPLGSTLEVPFRGAGWVFLGEAGSKRGLPYVSRRIDTEGQNFIFQAEETGEYELRFYKQDFIRDYILNDHVRVIVEDVLGENSFFYTPPGTGQGDAGNSVVAEPRWPLPAADPGAAAGTERPENGGGAEPVANGNTGAVLQGPEGGANTTSTTTATPPVAPTAAIGAVPAQRPPVGGSAVTEKEDVEPAALVRRAREEQEGGHIPEALALLDRFRERFPLGSDEAWWLYGQLLEAPGPMRDIRRALEFYRRLVKEYPQSTRREDAKKRIAYLERFYFNIR
ncbi:MAG: tetratricopeptide repeat protein [Treponema sp.]|nr:tetratricopeptide repeat protein [Treponema sp.]